MKVCIVIANYYPQISRDLLLGATKVLKKNGVKKFKIILAPGVFEFPVLIASSIKNHQAKSIKSIESISKRRFYSCFNWF